MTHRPPHWYTPGDVSVPARCHPGMFAKAVDPYDLPDRVPQPDVGDDDLSTPRLLPHVVPVVNVYHVPPARTRSGSGASSAKPGAPAAVIDGAAGGGGGAPAFDGIHAEPNPYTPPPPSSIQYPSGVPALKLGATATTLVGGGDAPSEPKNGLPKLNTPPSAPTMRYPAPDATMPATGRLRGVPPIEPLN